MMKTYVVEDITEFLDNCTDEEMRELLDDNGGSPDGNAWLPLERISETEAREALGAAFDRAGTMVEEVFRGSSRELLEYAHGEDVDLSSLDDDEIEDEAWSVAQNLGRYYARYSASDVIVCANDLQ
jgi:hypothetical protein